MQRKKTLHIVGGVLMLASVTACSRLGNKEPVYDNLPARSIFTLAEQKLEEKEPEKAAKIFGEIERLYPYSDLAKRALIMQAFSYHKDKDYENSRIAAQRFIDFYPADEDAAYAEYLLALSYYDQIDEVGRDQGLTFQALQGLRVLAERRHIVDTNGIPHGHKAFVQVAGYL